MAFSFSDEQEEFRAVVRRFLEERSPISEVRRLMEEPRGYDPEVWKQLCGELALPGVHLPEAYGGQGFTPVELGIALEEMGRALLCAPFFASAVLGAGAVSHGASESQRAEWLPAIASGECIATLAWTEPGGRWDAAATALVANPQGSGVSLSGQKTLVVDGHNADLILVLAREPGSVGDAGLALYAVRGNSAGLSATPHTPVDPTRKLARLDFEGVSAERVGEAGDGARALAATLDDAAIALSNEAVGGAQIVLETAVEYAKNRMQFGRPIGSFQAIKHKCADMLLEIELAKSAAYYAADAWATGDEERPALASLAKALCTETYLRAAAENIQIHGGVGFTWEYDAHLYFKRAKASEVFLGDPSLHRERYAEHLGLGPATAEGATR